MKLLPFVSLIRLPSRHLLLANQLTGERRLVPLDLEGGLEAIRAEPRPLAEAFVSGERRPIAEDLLAGGFIYEATPEQERFVRSIVFMNVDIEASTPCNARCRICPREAIERSQGAMDLATFEALAAKLCAAGTRVVFFAGMGDPLLNPRLGDMVRYLKERRGGDVLVKVVTNAAALSERRREELLDAGIDAFHVSFLGSTPESYKREMVTLRYERVMPNVERLLERARGRGVRVDVGMVAHRGNLTEIAPYQSLWRKQGVEPLVAMVHSRGGNLADPEVYEEPPFEARPVELDRCGLFNTQSFIAWNGDVLSCCHDLRGGTRLGNLAADPIDTIIDRKFQVIQQRSWFPVCNGCDEGARHAVTGLPLSAGAAV